jgi:hypothetical protein
VERAHLVGSQQTAWYASPSTVTHENNSRDWPHSRQIFPISATADRAIRVPPLNIPDPEALDVKLEGFGVIDCDALHDESGFVDR